MITVCIAGKFDPLHEGHVDHIKKAHQLGDYLVVITHPDKIVAQYSKKGFCYKPLNERVSDLYSQPEVGLVVIDYYDDDGTVTNILKVLQPNIFAKGGDRTPDNMPQSEIDACHEIGTKIFYGIGDLLNSSSELVANAK